MSKLPVIEIFGPTIQGEGAVIGLKTMFVRLYGCDYKCKWCDSSFTWDGTGKKEVTSLHIEEISKKLTDLGLDNCTYVTLSGGNPALYGEPVKELIQLLQEKEKKIVVETQGSIWQDWFSHVDVLTISPKPPSSGMKTNWDTLDTIVRRVNEANTSLKVVIFDNEDYLYARQVHMRYPSYPFYLQVGNDDVKESGNISGRLLKKLEWLFEKVLDDSSMNGARVLPQLHALIWNNERGK